MPSRRQFLATAYLTAAGLVSAPKSLQAQPPLETTTVRLPGFAVAGCEIPQYVAEELLLAEGFEDVRYVKGESGVDPSVWMARGELDFDWNYAAVHLASMEAGTPITVLAGLHSGCLELIANDRVHGITDLRGKRVGVSTLSSSPHVLLMLMTAYVGLDPYVDIQWIADADTSPMEMFIDGKIDALLASPPEPQELRARKIGHSILNTTVDRPWAAYFCCMIAGSTEYVRRYPVATKRVLRALFKAIDRCDLEPKIVAEQMAGGGLRSRSDYAFETLSDARYNTWREFDPEDTLRFYALRMREVGLIKSDPKQMIANGADWRFLNELKRELRT